MHGNSLRRLLTLIAATVVLGTAAGVASSYYRQGRDDRVFAFSKPTATDIGKALGPDSGVAKALRSRLVVDGGTTFDFGTMSRNERRSHTFRVRNEGNRPLYMRYLDKTCQCTEVKMTKTEVAPGESNEITLTWQPSTLHLDFEQSARFETNDPSRIELDLTVKGRVQQVVQAIPRSVSFDNVTTGHAREQTLRVFAYQNPDLRVERIEMLDRDTAEFFETEIAPMSVADLANEIGAVAGQQITVRLKPGLGKGRFHQRLRLFLNTPVIGPLEVQVIASVVGRITLTGPGYDPTRGVWNLGKLPGGQELTRTLWILVRNEDSTDIQLNVKAADPADVLRAEIVPSGQYNKYAVKLSIRPTGRVVNRLGNGQGDLAELVIESSLRDTPELRIPIAIAVENQP